MITKNKVIIVLIYVCVMVGTCACAMNSAGYNYESARNHYNKGEYDKALQYIDKAINVDEKAEYFILKADIERGLNKNDEALAILDKGISKGNSDVDKENNKQIFFSKAIIYVSQGNNIEALKSLGEAEKIKEYEVLDKEILKYKVDILVRSKNYKESLKEANRFIKKYGNDSDVYRMMGDCKVYLDKKDEGMKFYDKAIKLGNSDAYFYKADAYAYLKEYDKAIEEYENCLVKNDKISREDIYIRQISCMLKAKEYDKADNLIQQGLNLENKKYESMFVLSSIALLEARGKYEDAYVKAQEYLADNGDDERIAQEIKFLETRIIK